MLKIVLAFCFCLLFFSSKYVVAQNIGIGTPTPLAHLHVSEGSVLFSAADDIPGTPAPLPTVGAGRRMMWYPDKAAFRAGYIWNTQWDNNNIGNYSFAAGNSTTASGQYSTA